MKEKKKKCHSKVIGVPFKSDWCAFKDIKSKAADELDVPLDEEEQPDEEDLILEYAGGDDDGDNDGDDN